MTSVRAQWGPFPSLQELNVCCITELNVLIGALFYNTLSIPHYTALVMTSEWLNVKDWEQNWEDQGQVQKTSSQPLSKLRFKLGTSQN